MLCGSHVERRLEQKHTLRYTKRSKASTGNISWWMYEAQRSGGTALWRNLHQNSSYRKRQPLRLKDEHQHWLISGS